MNEERKDFWVGILSVLLWLFPFAYVGVIAIMYLNLPTFQTLFLGFATIVAITLAFFGLFRIKIRLEYE